MSRPSKTAAIRFARQVAGDVIRQSRTSCVRYAPYYMERITDMDTPTGPLAEVRHDSYSAAIASRARDVAQITLQILGHAEADTVDERFHDNPASIETILASYGV